MLSLVFEMVEMWIAKYNLHMAKAKAIHNSVAKRMYFWLCKCLFMGFSLIYLTVNWFNEQPNRFPNEIKSSQKKMTKKRLTNTNISLIIAIFMIICNGKDQMNSIEYYKKLSIYQCTNNVLQFSLV